MGRAHPTPSLVAKVARLWAARGLTKTSVPLPARPISGENGYDIRASSKFLRGGVQPMAEPDILRLRVRKVDLDAQLAKLFRVDGGRRA